MSAGYRIGLDGRRACNTVYLTEPSFEVDPVQLPVCLQRCGEHDGVERLTVHHPGLQRYVYGPDPNRYTFQQVRNYARGLKDQGSLVQQAAAGDRFKVFEGQWRVGEQFGEPGSLGLVPGHLSHAGFVRPNHPRIGAAGGEIGVDQQAGLNRIARIKARHQKRQRITTCATCRTDRIEDGDRRAALCQGVCGARPRNSGAKHGNLSRRCWQGAQAIDVGLRGRRLGEPCFEPLAFAAMTGRPGDVEAGLCQPSPHGACHRERPNGRAGLGAFRDQAIKISRPHLFILRRAEPVEEPRICHEAAGGQGVVNVAEMKRQSDAKIRPDKVMHAAHRLRPVRQQSASQRRQFRPGGQRLRRIGRRQGESFKADKVQPRLRGRAARLPQLAQGEEVQPGAEPGLGHGELVPAVPGLRQAATLQEYGAGFGQAISGREVDIPRLARDGRAIFLPVDCRMRQQAGHARWGSRVTGL